MTRTILAVAAAMAVVGCSGSDNSWPDVEQLYSVSGSAISCAGAVAQSGDPAGTEYVCAWERVQVQGQPRCYATATFTRPDTSSAWNVYVFGSGATCD